MRSINPTCKFFGIFLSAIILAVFYVPELNFFVLAACMAATVSAHPPAKLVLAVMLPTTLLAVGIFFSAYRFSSDTVIGAHRGIFSDVHMLNGLLLSGRLLAFAALGMLFILTTDQIDFIRSLNLQLKLPAKFAYGIIAAWGMFPRMVREYAKTRSAFRARGLRTGFASPALLLPLLVKSVRWSEAIAIAMESKGFSESGVRTALRTYPMRSRDVAFLILPSLAVIACGLLLTV
ncbi:MAG: energy-coupling factor transporter transmembrane protein EcfT [Clostridiales Family XIII bacterium]|jgi:energy-coupling factor transporter transmembrane protein EcfT|nr:energy-coupling factor transporter transmembrane protein EcfT [Clostridiales Family XIII bacterium]